MPSPRFGRRVEVSKTIDADRVSGPASALRLIGLDLDCPPDHPLSPVLGIALDLVPGPPHDRAGGPSPLLPRPHRVGVDAEEPGEEDLAPPQQAADPPHLVRLII